jgi:hypothetical protein
MLNAPTVLINSSSIYPHNTEEEDIIFKSEPHPDCTQRKRVSALTCWATLAVI